MQNHPPETATYTTIPITISASDVLSRSLHNLSGTLSRHLRPWPQLLGSGSQSFSRPNSFLSRATANLRYFRANYSLVVAAAGALSLIGSPFSLLLCCAVLALWLLLFFFREDPLVVWGHCVSDRLLLFSLASLSLLAVWLCGVLQNLALGLGIGALACGAHALLRNSDGLFLDENDAVSSGFVRSSAAATATTKSDVPPPPI